MGADWDSLVLVYHPDPAKNHALRSRFEQYHGKPGLQTFRYNGGKNQSEFYKVPDKLPALVLFRRVDGLKAVIEFQLVQELMVDGLSQADFNRHVDDFIAQASAQF